MQIIKGKNLACAYFPCHKNLEDCTFCYCPFYPCGNTSLGKYILTKEKNRVWSCKDCIRVHKKKFVDELKTTGVIILAHGSKRKKANAIVNKVIKTIRDKGVIKIVEPSYLQFSSPNLHVSIEKIVKKGCKKIIVLPFFLFTGNHVSRDIPKEIAAEARIYKNIEFVYAKNIGSDPRIGDIVLNCIFQAL